MNYAINIYGKPFGLRILQLRFLYPIALVALLTHASVVLWRMWPLLCLGQIIGASPNPTLPPGRTNKSQEKPPDIFFLV